MTNKEEEKNKKETERKTRPHNWRKDNKTTDYNEEELQMGDVFDVTKEILIVHSPISTMNPDFILSDLDPKLLENPLITYVREQLKVVEAINIHLSDTILEDEYWREKINQIMLNELYSLVIISRPKEGRVIKAILDYIKGNVGNPTETPITEEPTKQTALQKMNPMNLFKKKGNNVKAEKEGG